MISWGIRTKPYEMLTFVTIFAIQISASYESQNEVVE